LGGNAFHARAPATGNARSPSEDWHVAGTTTSALRLPGSYQLATEVTVRQGHPLQSFAVEAAQL